MLEAPDMRHLATLFVILAACTGTDTPDPGQRASEPFEIAAVPRTPFDLLVVLDDTAAMENHLPREPSPGQIGVPVHFYNGAPDVRIAVTTTTTGTLRTSALVPSGIIEHTVSFEDGALRTSYTGTLADAIASLVNVGTSSTAPNAVLANTISALNGGFVRDGAAVGILLSTASDDESPDEVASYAAAVHAAASRVGVVVVNANPVPRLSAFADAFATRKVMPMDQYNMSAVEIFAGLFWVTPPPACFPLAPPDATACEVFTSYNEVVNPLPACTASAGESTTPCWAIIEDASCPTGHALLLGGGYQMYHPQLLGQCQV